MPHAQCSRADSRCPALRPRLLLRLPRRSTALHRPPGVWPASGPPVRIDAQDVGLALQAFLAIRINTADAVATGRPRHLVSIMSSQLPPASFSSMPFPMTFCRARGGRLHSGLFSDSPMTRPERHPDSTTLTTNTRAPYQGCRARSTLPQVVGSHMTRTNPQAAQAHGAPVSPGMQKPAARRPCAWSMMAAAPGRARQARAGTGARTL